MIEASVVIATYNRADRLRACLEALSGQTQTASDFEVVVAVDGSQDSTLEMLEALETPYHLHWVFQENRGQAAALNLGASQAQGDVLVFLDDDMVVSPEFVAAHLRLHLENRAKNLAGVGKINLRLPENAGWFLRWYAWEWEQHFLALDQGARQPEWDDCYGGNMSVRREAYLAVGGNAEDLKRLFDMDMAYKLHEYGYEFVYLPQACSVQDERKPFAALVREAELAGEASVELYRRHPQVLAKTIGMYGEQSPGVSLAWRLLLDTGISALHLERLRRWTGKRSQTFFVYRFLTRYSFWRGVRRGLGDRETWQRLIEGVPILMYHAFGSPGEAASRFVLPVKRFARQLAWLKRRGYQVIGLEEYLEIRRSHRLPPRRAVVLTMDDGYLDNYTLAFPTLRKQGGEGCLPATVFLVSQSVGGVYRWDAEPGLFGRQLLNWEQAHQMAAGGIRFGAHTRTHPNLTMLPTEQAQLEIEGSRQDLEARLGALVLTFSYPFGEKTKAVEAQAEEAGFWGSCGVDSGMNTPITRLHALRRVEVYGTDSLLHFALIVRFGARPHSIGRWVKAALLGPPIKKVISR